MRATSTIRRSRRSPQRKALRSLRRFVLPASSPPSEKKFTKKDGKPFAVIALEDFTGQIELTAWDDVFAEKASLLNPGSVISVTGRGSIRRDDSVRAAVRSIAPLKPKASVKPVRLRLARGKLTEGALPGILEAVRRFPGKRPLIIEIVNDEGVTFEIQAAESLAVGDESGLKNAVLQFAAAA